MGTFSVRVTFEGSQGQLECDALVETGASYAILPASMLRSIGVEPNERRVSFRKRSGETVYRDIGHLYVRYEGSATPNVVVFGDEDVAPALGFTTLECMGYEADEPNERIVRARGLMPSIRLV